MKTAAEIPDIVSCPARPDGPALAPAVERHCEPVLPGTAVPAWWKPLFLAACNASIFLSEDWLQTWLDIYGGEFQGFWIHWRVDEAVVGGGLVLLRLVRKRCVPLHSIFLNATGEAAEPTPLAEFNDILYQPGYEEAIAVDLARLFAHLRWDRLLLSGHTDGGLFDRLIPRLPAALVERDCKPSPYVDLAALAGASFETTLSANTRNQIRRSRRLYEERLGRISLVPAASGDEAMAYLAELERLHNTRWESKGESGCFVSRPVADFHRRLVARAWPSRAIDLLRVCAGETAIGYLYNFVHRGKVYFFQSGLAYDHDSRLKPGLLTHSLAIEHYRQAGLREYDFLAGDSQYKRSLAKQYRNLCWSVVYRDRPRVRLVLRARNIVAWLASSGKPLSSALR